MALPARTLGRVVAFLTAMVGMVWVTATLAAIATGCVRMMEC